MSCPGCAVVELNLTKYGKDLMSNFLDRLEKIKVGVPAPLGFGAPRAEKMPGMALVGLVSQDHAKDIEALAALKPDAVLISGVDDPSSLKEFTRPLEGNVPWGANKVSLTEEDAKELEAAGCGLLAFSLSGATVAALESEEIARILHVEADVDQDQLRAIDALPVDVLLVSVPAPSTPWTLQDLANVARVGRRVDKYVLVEIAEVPGSKELEAIRNAGVNGLVLNVGKVDAQSLSELKTALLDMPRQRPRIKERAMALLSNPASSSPASVEPEHDEPDEDE